MKSTFPLILFSVWAGLSCSAMEVTLDTEHSHVFATAKATGHHFTAEPEKFDCHLAVTEAGDLISATFSLQFVDLKTGKPKRDKEMLHWLEAEQFPALQFEMTGLKLEDDRQMMLGTVTFHGITSELVIPITIRKEDTTFRLMGETALDVTDFGLKKIRKMAILTVDPVLQIHFDLIGELGPQTATTMHATETGNL